MGKCKTFPLLCPPAALVSLCCVNGRFQVRTLGFVHAACSCVKGSSCSPLCRCCGYILLEPGPLAVSIHPLCLNQWRWIDAAANCLTDLKHIHPVWVASNRRIGSWCLLAVTMTGIMPVGIISGFTGLVLFSSLNLVKAFLLTSAGFGLDWWRALFKKILPQIILSGHLLNLIFIGPAYSSQNIHYVQGNVFVTESQDLQSW